MTRFTDPYGRSNKQVVLDTLRERPNQWISGNALVEAGGGWRYGDCIFRLRREGHPIENRPDPEGRTAVHQYRYVDERPVAGQVPLPWGQDT